MTAAALGDIVEIRKGKKPTLVHDTPSQGRKPCILIDEVRGVAPSSFTSDQKGVEARPEDLCIVWDGANAGTVGFGVSGFLGSTVARLRLKRPDIWDTEFVGRLLQGQFASLNEAAKGKGATIPHVDKRHLENLLIPRYPLDEQKRIAAILDQADELRRKRQLAIERLNRLGQAIFEEMFADGGDCEIEIEELLVDGSIVVHKDGNHGSNYPRKEEFGTEGVPFLSATAIDDDGQIIPEYVQYLNESKAKSLKIGWIQEGDVLLSHNASVGKVCHYKGEYGPALIGTSLTCFRPNKSYFNSEFLFLALKSSRFQSQLSGNMSQTTRNQVPITSQRRLKLIRPPVDRQQVVSETLGNVARQIKNYAASRAKLDRLFASLECRAFRGEL